MGVEVTAGRVWTRALLALVIVGALVGGIVVRSAPAERAESASGSPTTAAHQHDADGRGQGSDEWPDQDSPCERAIGPGGDSQGLVTDKGTSAGGHDHHGSRPQTELTPAERTILTDQQRAARAAVERYPTARDAMAAGYSQATDWLPCIGTHYANLSLIDRFDPGQPSELLYNGNGPDAPLIGLSYVVVSKSGAPEGFAGTNDVWHQHLSRVGFCLDSQGLVIEDVDDARCVARGGHIGGETEAAQEAFAGVPLQDIWMLHDWIAPGWESAWGVFADENPDLGLHPVNG